MGCLVTPSFAEDTNTIQGGGLDIWSWGATHLIELGEKQLQKNKRIKIYILPSIDFDSFLSGIKIEIHFDL